MQSTEAHSEWKHIFVYGTLKRGQCREKCWPLQPLQIRQAWTLGKLIDLGPYPALLEGNDRIHGELWSFKECDIAWVRQVLDKVEVTNQPGVPNEYDRVPVLVQLFDGGEVTAETYRLASQSSAFPMVPVAPSLWIQDQRYVVWPALLDN
jgi:gamma-glutamylcyclotransferase (GGCT)/AIG2-like uncharacterized protein YtfP